MSDITLSAGPRAFGDGSHPTTRGVLEVIAGVDPALFSPESALDMGAGSGILSFAIAEKFGCPVLAVDLDPEAVRTIQANESHNKTGLVLSIQSNGFNSHIISKKSPYNMVVMNILAEPLLAMARDAEAHLAPDGLLILSGMLQWQESQIREAYERLGLELSARVVIGDWVTLAWQK